MSVIRQPSSQRNWRLICLPKGTRVMVQGVLAGEDVTQLARQKTVVKFCPITRDTTEAPPLVVGRKGEFRWAFSSDFERIAGFSQPNPKDVN